jgi:hypothetical protein
MKGRHDKPEALKGTFAGQLLYHLQIVVMFRLK